MIKRETVRDAAAEVERFKGALDLTLKKTEELAQQIIADQSRGEGSRDHAGPYDASDQTRC
ncbi:MAG: hypothetical protein ACLTF6_00005 [Clostridium sp.]